MIRSNIKKQFSCDRNKLWNIITDNSNYAWRSDLSKIVIVDEKHFIEYTKNNFPTYFTITSKCAISCLPDWLVFSINALLSFIN